MRTFSASDAADQFPQLLQAARRAPVTVVDHGRPAAVLLSIEDYARLRGAAWDRLQATMVRARQDASDRGLNDEQLEALLAEDS
jgi:prevent-host-death family protein